MTENVRCMQSRDRVFTLVLQIIRLKSVVACGQYVSYISPWFCVTLYSLL